MTVRDLKSAIEKLRTSDPKAGFPGREGQIKDLETFLIERLKIRQTEGEKQRRVQAGLVADVKRHVNKIMFVCGVPGTGKTAVVMSVVDKLVKQLRKKPCPIHPFKYYYINGQQVTDLQKIYSEIFKQITDKQASPEIARQGLDKIFQTSQTKGPVGVSKKQCYVVIIDELDLLYNDRRQNVLYSLFDWPNASSSNLILITIANAMDLPDRFSHIRINSRFGWDKLVFEPYTSQHLETILKARLGSSLLAKCFDNTAIVLATKRIGKSTGDARRIIDTCWQALEEAVSRKADKVTAKIIDEVGFQNIDKTKVQTLNSLPLLHKIALKAILSESECKGGDNVNGKGVYERMIALLKVVGRGEKESNEATCWVKNHVLAYDEFFYILTELNAYRFICLEHEHTVFAKRMFIKDDCDVFRDTIRAASISTDLEEMDLKLIKDCVD